MVKKTLKALFSPRFMAILIFMFAIAVAVATFIENDFGPDTSKAIIYNSKWFELIMLLLVINLTGSIVINKMYKRNKIPVFLFHSAFIVILYGAFITRYIGEEGYMHIREGETTNRILTSETYFDVKAEWGSEIIQETQKVLLSPITKNQYSKKFNLGKDEVEIKIKDYIPKASYELSEADNGSSYIEIITTGGTGRESVFIKEGKFSKIGDYSISFNTNDTIGDIHISMQSDSLKVLSKYELNITNKNSWGKILLEKNKTHPFTIKTLYSIDGKIFVLKRYVANASLNLKSGEQENTPGAIKLGININNLEEELLVWGKKDKVGDVYTYDKSGIIFQFRYGSKYKEIPFSLKLNDFQLSRYPGSKSPSSFRSFVVLSDRSKNLNEEKEIFMNNVLKHRGYRFYQSSYDSDEKGTILSVNKDFFGTFFTYLGYFMLTVGMFLSLFNKNSRFQLLQKLTRASAIILLLLLTSETGNASEYKWKSELDENTIDNNHAAEFGKLLIQDNHGRIKPINTLSSQILRKVARKTSLDGLTPDQVLLGMLINPEYWQSVPFIKVSHPEIRQLLGTSSSHVSFNDMFGNNTRSAYLLNLSVEEAFQKKPAYRTKFDNEIIRTDERVNICYVIYTSSILKIFPLPENTENRWVSPGNSYTGLHEMDSIFISSFLSLYLNEVKKSLVTDSIEKPNEYLDYLKIYQQKYGDGIIPVKSKVNLELWYNKSNIFGRLSNFYGFFGIILLIINLISLLSGKAFSWLNRSGFWLIFTLFILHAIGLGMRWYISGHAPWSNGYEALIYISWATILAGIIFSRKSAVTMPATAVLAFLILHVAHLSWMDPEITTLVPVLKSIWLVIHVAVITSSYGFLALGALLSFVNLVLMNFMNRHNSFRVHTHISLLSKVIEMTLIIGLYLLTIGTFLGGVWANESWGRYWGWDPKEAWAWITVLVYVFIVHLRFIPGLKGKYAFNFFALFGYSSVIMTYFGVNYYLSGLHSYAKGDPLPFPIAIVYSLIILSVISAVAYLNYRRFPEKT